MVLFLMALLYSKSAPRQTDPLGRDRDAPLQIEPEDPHATPLSPKPTVALHTTPEPTEGASAAMLHPRTVGESKAADWHRGISGQLMNNITDCVVHIHPPDLPHDIHEAARGFQRFDSCPGAVNFSMMDAEGQITSWCRGPVTVAHGSGLKWRAEKGVVVHGDLKRRRLPSEFVRLQCSSGRGRRPYNIHTRVLPRGNMAMRTTPPATPLLIVLLDATSRSMFHRLMPRTARVLQAELGGRYDVVEFFRFNALGGNTRHNTPFLFGGAGTRGDVTNRLWLQQLMQKMGYVNAVASDHFKATAVAHELEPYCHHVLAFREMFAPSKVCALVCTC